MPTNIALSGLNAAFTRARVAANNIANVSTNGFKQSRVETVAVQGGGVRVAQVRPQLEQGYLNITDSAFDLGISGNGYFQLNDQGKTVYSRDGAFSVDREGYIVNSSGQRLQGFQNGGTTPADLRVDRSVSAPTATSEMSLNVNLDATESVPLTAFDPNDSSSYNHKISTTVYDSLGETHQMDLYFRNTAVSGSVEMSAYVDGNQVLAPNTMTFNSAGRLSSSASVSIPGFNVGNGSEDMNITLNTSEISRYASDFSVNSIQQDGYSSGSATAISVGKDGRVSALYSNGETRDVGQVALADFPNPQGLSRLGNNGFAQSHESGSATVGYAGSGSLGQVQAGTLETSNVNLEEQLIQLKMAQREVQANVQVLKAEGEMIGSLFRDKA